jgi:predicted permease
VNEFFRRVRYLLNRRRFDEELASDMEFHREMSARAGGVPLGNSLRLREESRDAWGWTWIDRSAQDLRYAARKLRRSPGFTVAAVLMLAVGIGMNVAAFGFFNLLFLRPLAIRNPETLLRFSRVSPQSYASNLPWPEVAFFREYSRTLSAVLGITDAKLTTEGAEKPVSAHFVTGNFFSELGAKARLGRVLDAARDDAANSEPAVVLSEGFWKRHFGADPAAIGKTIRLNDKPATVIGIAPREFSGLGIETPDVWAQITRQPYFIAGSQLFTDYSVDSAGVRMFGRLQPGLSAKIAEDELRRLAADLRRQHPDTNTVSGIWENESLPSKPGGYANSSSGSHHGSGQREGGEVKMVFGLIGSLVLLILAVACGNLGSLLLARGVAREREISIRVSVGAGRSRLVRQLFTESLLLALLGSVAGLAVGCVVLRVLLAWADAPAWLDPTPDWRVVVFAIGTGFAAAIVFGLAPAFQVVRNRHRTTIMRQFLVGAQVAASCVLLIVAGLLVRALDRAMYASPGFEYEQVISIDPGLFSHGYAPEQARAYLDQLQSRFRNLPGVESVSLSSLAPLGNKKVTAGVTVDGHALSIHTYRIDPEFFRTMKIPLLRGRNLVRGQSKSVVVSETLARRAWPAQDPVGRQLTMGDDKYTVVGVAGSAPMVAMQDSDAVESYFLAGTADLPSMVLLVRASGPPEGLVPFVVSVAKSVEPGVLPQVQLLRTAFKQKLLGAGKSAVAVSVLGFVALLLACLGIVGVVAYAVSQRIKEIGIRMALGAEPAHVLSLVLRQFARPVVAGLLLGAGGAAALSQILRRMLYGISSLDPATYVSAVGLFVTAVVLAALLPARRALRVDPMQALRHD